MEQEHDKFLEALQLFDQILEACKSNGVQFMDGSMWLHHPRTAKLKDLVSDPKLFGQIDIAQFQYARIEVSVRTRLPPRI
ncbi:hypothetical protein FF1_009774 [Malus domestica]